MNCQCVIRYDQDSVTKVETFVSAIKCTAHKDVPDNELMGVIKDNVDAEVHIKAAIERELVKFDELGVDIVSTDKDGVPYMTREFKPDAMIQIIFTGSGKQRKAQIITSMDLKAPQKQSVKDAIKSKMGDKVHGRLIYE